ncbi:L-histidine N(alpha)-methyltransferase [Novosphingobium sp. JCM 18896]|uniref:L-histidine N(alpha)-methyltransferase n=1 Tax=Novosphingobium sp. JCM 18896 TaxID=2989731 RepID=UPI002221A86B|nr:L-histidine N(alpha)-methyltransferase [Novosphingobium sp. JCM 18896]MCW1428027.1 L-histidine N(alpha)-methyltransferase [Novosphingobium sp. JCM 18896]
MATQFEQDLIEDRPSDRLRDQFRADVLTGLRQRQKVVPARWFYDLRGSELFEEITRLPEYYPTRAEIEILANQCSEIGAAVGEGRAVVEFGAGSATKTPLLLDCIAPAAYVPIDISGEFLREACKPLARRYPDLPIVPVEGDFTHPLTLPGEVGGSPVLGFFPGSTIGNLAPAEAVDLLRAMRATLGDGSVLLIGMDMIKDRQILLDAYDDGAGVTAAFNLNLAARINRELDGDIPIDALRHNIVWNVERARIEMHLEAVRDIAFEICAQHFAMRAGETIHTENSHKYDLASATQLLLAGHWTPFAHFQDSERRFMVLLARADAGLMTA